MRNKRTKPNRRQRGSLRTPTSKEPGITQNSWFRGLSVASTFSVSLALVYAMGSTVPANALSIDITGFLGSLKSVMQSDSLSAAFRVNTAQTARYPSDVARHTFQAETRKAAILTGEERARRLTDLRVGHTPSVGFTSAFTCTPHAERTNSITRLVNSEANADGVMMVAAGTYSSTSSTKTATRAFEHLSSFCDSSEMSQGLCISKPNGLGGADSNYATISSNSYLTPEAEQAAYAFMLNIVDPSSTEQDMCSTVACESLKAQNRVYQSLSSMSQNAFINQINDSKIYSPADGSTGSTPAETLAENGSVASNSTDGENQESTGNSAVAET